MRSFLTISRPVSYTHLDVYKRQVIGIRQLHFFQYSGYSTLLERKQFIPHRFSPPQVDLEVLQVIPVQLIGCSSGQCIRHHSESRFGIGYDIQCVDLRMSLHLGRKIGKGCFTEQHGETVSRQYQQIRQITVIWQHWARIVCPCFQP